MIAGIYFDSDKWFQKLRDKGCNPVEGKSFKGETQQYYLWETSWGHKFLVPNHCTYDEADEIIEKEITQIKPITQ
jgi:hypothetical protein